MAYDRTAPRRSKDRVRITKQFVERNLPAGLYIDEKVPGFQLKVTDAGSKVYRVYGKVKGHKNAITVTIGHHNQPAPKAAGGGNWTAQKAEETAKIIWGQMKAGIDPNAEKGKAIEAHEADRQQKLGLKKAKEITLQRAFDDYLHDANLRESTAYVYACTFKACGDLRKAPLVSISEDDIKAVHAAVSKDHPGHANHLMRILRAVFNYACAAREYNLNGKPIIESNPVSRWAKSKKSWNTLGKRDNILKDHHLKAFFTACHELEHAIASDYFPFLLLTGLRAEEAASLPWKHVYFKSREIRITETKNGQGHHLPLTNYLYAMLKARPKNSVYVFGCGPDTYMSDFRYQLRRVITRCRELLAESEDEEIRMDAEDFDFVPHDLRRTFGTVAARLLPEYIVKRLLNHVNSSDVTQTHYIHADIDRLRDPLNTVNEHILRCAEVSEYGSASVRKPSVVPITFKMKKRSSPR